MKMTIQADEEYNNAIFYVLNKIKKELLFDNKDNQIVNYYFSVNIKKRPGLSLMKERAILQRLRKDGIISDTGEVVISETGQVGMPDYEVYEIYHFKVSKKFNDYHDRYQRIQNVTQSYCWFDNNTFFLTLRDSSKKVISFDAQRGNKQGLVLFQIMIEHWKKNGSKPMTHAEIVKGMAKAGIEVKATQLNTIIANVRRTKINPAGLGDKIHIKFDKKANNGWSFDIER